MRNLLRGLRVDLVEHRLLPIPVLLVAGLIAIPALASKERSSATAESLPAVAATTTTTPATTTPRGSTRVSSRDPFGTDSAAQAPASNSTRSSTTTTTKSRSTSTSTSSSPSPPAARSQSTPTRSNTQTLSPSRSGASGSTRKRWTLRAVDLRFGTAVRPKLRRDVARLTVFPSAKDPIALMFGTLATRKAVVFYLIADLKVRGSGSCVPRVTLCTQLVLRPGQRVVLTTSNGKRYRLSVARVRTRSTTSSRRAARAYARVSKAGQCVLDTFGAFDYSRASGNVSRPSSGKGCRYGTAKPKILGTGR